jgi:hypothetical protein
MGRESADQEQYEHEEHTDRCRCSTKAKIISEDEEQGYEEQDGGRDSKHRLQCISNDNVGMLVKVANRVRKQAPPAAPSAPSTTEKLLTDIRDALVSKK